MPQRLYQVDAFSDRPFAGNPAAVCPLAEPRPAAWMQAVATEMNLSETAFLVARREDPAAYDLRWFTPAVEVDLCGHATLAAAHVLWETGALAAHREARFHTRSGLLRAERRAGGLIRLDFPATAAEPSADDPAVVAAALGRVVGDLRFIGRSRFDLLVELAGERAVREIFPRWPELAGLEARGVIVTARGNGSGYDFVSRFFAPGSGILEDPVTGSAHCALGPFWAPRLGSRDLIAYQASARGGVVRVEVGEDGRVGLAGHAVTVLTGELRA